MNEVYLAHHGVKGQKWGVRRYQNDDGTLTAAGKKRYESLLKTTKSGKYTVSSWNKMRRQMLKDIDADYKEKKQSTYGFKDNVKLLGEKIKQRSGVTSGKNKAVATTYNNVSKGSIAANQALSSVMAGTGYTLGSTVTSKITTGEWNIGKSAVEGLIFSGGYGIGGAIGLAGYKKKTEKYAKYNGSNIY